MNIPREGYQMEILCVLVQPSFESAVPKGILFVYFLFLASLLLYDTIPA